MKKFSVIFLQAVVVLIGIVALAVLVRFPMLEGRAKDLDIISIYSDPLILYACTASIAFFIALYNAFRVLGCVRQNLVFSPIAVKRLKNIKYCAIALGVFIVGAGIYVNFTHAKEDDPAGFFAMCFVTAFASAVVATAAAIFEKVLQNAIDMKSENDLTI